MFVDLTASVPCTPHLVHRAFERGPRIVIIIIIVPRDLLIICPYLATGVCDASDRNINLIGRAACVLRVHGGTRRVSETNCGKSAPKHPAVVAVHAQLTFERSEPIKSYTRIITVYVRGPDRRTERGRRRRRRRRSGK